MQTPSLPPIRVAHIADTHLGYRALTKPDPETERDQRAVDVERAFERVIDSILEQRPHLVLHAGDVFHHTRPTWHAMRVFIKQMRRLEHANIPVVLIAGNHDTPRLRTGGTAFSVLELALPNVRFVTNYDVEVARFPDLGVTVHAVPHGALSLNAIGPTTYLDNDVRNVMLLHGMIPGMDDLAHYEPGTEEIDNALLDPTFDYIALGHYHKVERPRSNARYAGSIERTGWGDEEATPGYLLLDFAEGQRDPQVVHLPIQARPMQTLKAIDGAGLPAAEVARLVLARIDGVTDPESMTRIELRNMSRPERREAEQRIKRELADRVWSHTCYTREDISSAIGDVVQHDDGIPDIRTLFGVFVDERHASAIYDDRFAATFRERGLAALATATDRVNQALAEEDR